MSWQELPLELDKLADSLRIAEGTMIAFAVVDTVPDRDALIRELRERLSGEAEICEIHLTPEQPNLLEQVSRGEVCLTPQGSDRAVYFVYGFEELSDEPRRQAIAGLNLQREALRRLSAPIVLWLAEGNLADVARLAPDFFSWRAGIYELRTALPLEQRAKAAIAEMLDSYSLSLIPACELRKRARLYEKLLSEQEDQPVPNPSAIAELYHNLGLIRYNLAEWGQASESFQKSLEVYEQLGDLAGLDRTYNNIGGIHYARGDYAAALGWYEKSVAICEKLGDPTRLAATYNNIGSIYDARGDYQVALELYEKSVAIFEKLGDQPGLATTYNNIGLIH
jgi:tetratricopeptide (TPR) repeat protein